MFTKNRIQTVVLSLFLVSGNTLAATDGFIDLSAMERSNTLLMKTSDFQSGLHFMFGDSIEQGMTKRDYGLYRAGKQNSSDGMVHPVSIWDKKQKSTNINGDDHTDYVMSFVAPKMTQKIIVKTGSKPNLMLSVNDLPFFNPAKNAGLIEYKKGEFSIDLSVIQGSERDTPITLFLAGLSLKNASLRIYSHSGKELQPIYRHENINPRPTENIDLRNGSHRAGVYNASSKKVEQSLKLSFDDKDKSAVFERTSASIFSHKVGFKYRNKFGFTYYADAPQFVKFHFDDTTKSNLKAFRLKNASRDEANGANFFEKTMVYDKNTGGASYDIFLPKPGYYPFILESEHHYEDEKTARQNDGEEIYAFIKTYKDRTIRKMKKSELLVKK